MEAPSWAIDIAISVSRRKLSSSARAFEASASIWAGERSSSSAGFASGVLVGSAVGDGTAVAVGTGVFVGTGVLVGGTGVAVVGIGVFVGTGVFVGGTGVGSGSEPHAIAIAARAATRRIGTILNFLRSGEFGLFFNIHPISYERISRSFARYYYT